MAKWGMKQQATSDIHKDSAALVPGVRSLITDAMVIATATAFAYFATFIYELGFCYHFDLPASLINPNVATILVAAGALCGVFIASVNFLGFTAPLFHAAGDPSRSSYRPLYLYTGMALFLGIIVMKVYDFGWRGVLGYLAGALFIGTVMFGPVLFLNRGVPLRERLDADMKIQRRDPFRFDRLLEFWLDSRAINCLYVFGAFLGFAWMIGNGNANTQTRFMTFRDAPDSVVLRNYGDLLIVAKFSRQTKQLTDELSLVWLSDKRQIDLRNEFVGPLSLPPEWGKAKSIANPAIPATQASPSAVSSFAPAANPASASVAASPSAPPLSPPIASVGSPLPRSAIHP